MNVITYMTSLLTFYLKGEIATDQNFLKLKIPNTILALIPLGSKRYTIPVQQVGTVSSNFKLNLKRFIVGVLIVLFSLDLITDSVVLGLIFLLWGASTVITSFVTELYVATTAGIVYTIPFLIFEKAKASQAEQLVNNMIAVRLNDTNNRQVAEAQTKAQAAYANAIIDAINNK